MPRTLAARHKLNNLAITPDKKMCRDFQPPELCVIRMRFRIQGICEQLCNCLTTKLPRRQTDIVYNQQIYRSAGWSCVAVMRGYPSHTAKPSICLDLH